MLAQANGYLRKCFVPGDALYIFAYSRGAATAMCLVDQIEQDGIEGRDGVWIKPSDTVPSPVVFMGLFDTVHDRRLPKRFTAIPSCVGHSLHFVALDDNRVSLFPTLLSSPTLVDEPYDDGNGTHLEVWFPGGHGDVGGGRYRQELSDAALSFMISVVTDPSDFLGPVNRHSTNRLELMRPEGVWRKYRHDPESGVLIQTDDLELKPNILGLMHGVDEDLAVRCRCWSAFDPNNFAHRSLHSATTPTIGVAPILVHISVLQRAMNDSAYRPANLLDAKFRVVYDDCLVTDRIYNGLQEALSDPFLAQLG